MNTKAIQEMRQWAMMTNKISDWHAKSLQQYPFIAFNNVKSVEIQYSIEKNEENGPFVRYIITSKGKLGKNAEEIQKRMEDCAKWVKNILWSDIDVQFIKADGKKLVAERKRTPKSTGSKSAI